MDSSRRGVLSGYSGRSIYLSLGRLSIASIVFCWLSADEYPVGTLPDENWRGVAFEFDVHNSPNGIIEYKGGTFNGNLKGKILVVRYVNNSDIIVLEPGGNKSDIISATEGVSIPGLSGFLLPLTLRKTLIPVIFMCLNLEEKAASPFLSRWTIRYLH